MISAENISTTGIFRLLLAKGTKEKQNIIKKYADNESFRRFLYYALNPLISYNLSEKTIGEYIGETKIDKSRFDNIFDCCEYLSNQKGVDKGLILDAVKVIQEAPEQDKIIYTKLLSKTLRLGVTAKTVNKIIPGLIPEWEVQQAFPIEKYPIKNGDEFWLTEKLNGVRATYYKGKLIGRSGAEFKGLQHIIRELFWFSEWGYVLDGELTLKDKGELSDNEAFRVATGILNSDSENKTAISFTIFDVIPIQDFDSEDPKMTYSKRRELLDGFSRLFCEGLSPVKVHEVLYHGTDQSKITELLNKMIDEDKEGLMLNTDVPYKRTRHKGILKIKRFYTMDLPIIRCEEGSGRNTGTLGAFVLDYKGNEVKVGSGFTDEQRTIFWAKRDELEGTLCEVKYKEISSDKNTGLESLQFPVFIQLRVDKSEPSYG